MSKYNIGDPVSVNDPGLLALQRFAPPGSRPNNEGWVSEVLDDGDLMILFPIGDEDPAAHTQTAPYSPDMVEPRDGERFLLKEINE